MKRVVLILGMCLGYTLLTGQSYFDSNSKRVITNKYDVECRFKVISYFDNDTTKIREIGCISDDGKTKVGEWVAYNRNGIKTASASFDNNGNKDGKWTIWDNEGKLLCEMYYSYGKRVGIWKMYKNNIVTDTVNYTVINNK
jgi:antitoxin component YwqK of YwqJK toxin-antitoxin module